MTNEYNQSRINRIIQRETDLNRRDMSGEMIWCEVCKYKINNECILDEISRTEKRICATAYNRMRRK